MQADVLSFFEKSMDALPLYEELIGWIQEAGPLCCQQVLITRCCLSGWKMIHILIFCKRC